MLCCCGLVCGVVSLRRARGGGCPFCVSGGGCVGFPVVWGRPRQGLDPVGAVVLRVGAAACYSPTSCRMQYHRRARSSLPGSEWVRASPLGHGRRKSSIVRHPLSWGSGLCGCSGTGGWTRRACVRDRRPSVWLVWLAQVRVLASARGTGLAGLCFDR